MDKAPSVKWSKTRFPGVRYWESTSRHHKGKADRCYVIRYKRHGATISETIGWASDGVTPQFASNLRGQIINNIRIGEGFQSLKEKRDQERHRREKELAKKAALEKENMPFDVLAIKYIEWAKGNKKTSWVDEGSWLSSETPVCAGPRQDGQSSAPALKQQVAQANVISGNSFEIFKYDNWVRDFFMLLIKPRSTFCEKAF